MATTIKTKNSTTAATAPTGLVQGELAVNITDKKLYVGDASGNSIQIAGQGATNGAGGSNTQVQYNSSGALAGSANFTYDGTSLSVGSATVVSANDIISATKSGELNIRVNCTNTTNGANLILSSGNGTTSSLYSYATYKANQTSAVNWYTGLYGSSSYTINNGSDRLVIDSSGNVGIGTSSPSVRLEVVGGNFKVNRGATNSVVTATLETNMSGSSSKNIINFFNMALDSGDPMAAIEQFDDGTNVNGTLIFKTNGAGTIAERMRLDSSGNLGLGVTPSAWTSGKAIEVGALGSSFWGFSSTENYVSTNTYYNSGVFKYATSAVATSYGQVSGQHRWYTAGSGTAGNAITFTQAMTLDASGRLLVGRTSSDANGYFLQLNGTSGYQAGVLMTYAGVGSAAIWENSSGALAFGNDGASGTTERMRIDSSGNLLVGTATANAKTYSVTSADQTALRGYNSNASFTNNIILAEADRNTTNGSFLAYGYYNNGAGAYKFKVLDSGNVQNTNNSYGAISDIKLKENIVDATPKLEDLCKVQVRQYTFKDDPEKLKQLGVIAQEVEQIFAGIVEETPDKDSEGNDLGTTTKAVKYSVFVPMLIKAVQELKAEVDSLKAQLAK